MLSLAPACAREAAAFDREREHVSASRTHAALIAV